MKRETAEPRTVVRAFLDAIEKHDPERARGLLADVGFHYRSPISEFFDAFIADMCSMEAVMASSRVGVSTTSLALLRPAEVPHAMLHRVRKWPQCPVNLPHRARDAFAGSNTNQTKRYFCGR